MRGPRVPWPWTGLGVCLLFLACGGAGEHPPLWADHGVLRARDGRTVILRGVNARAAGVFDVSFDDGRQPLEAIPAFAAADARRARQLGFNVLRLPVNWSGLEPSRGVFPAAYLNAVGQVVEACRAAGMWVVLDLHQDAWSKEIGEDGAPRWAISPPPDTLLSGPLTDLGARRTSQQVTRAFKAFFGGDADGLQEEFARAAATLAGAFAAEDAVAGVELFNEPLASDAELLPFHVKVARAVRERSPKLVFFEPGTLRNFTDSAPLADAPFPLPDAVYAPHVYTLAFSDPMGERKALTYERLAPSVRGALDEARSWDAPLFIGEFGIGPDGVNFDRWLRYELDAQDETLASSALWLWKEESQGSWGLFDHQADGGWVERPAMIQAATRPYVQVAGGDLLAMRFDAGGKALRYEVARTAALPEDEVFVPEWIGPLRFSCDGVALAAARDPATGVVKVRCGDGGTHTVEARP